MTVTVNATTKNQPIDGFGATMWAPLPYTATWGANVLDFLFSQDGNNLGMSIYNVPITSDSNGNGWPLYLNSVAGNTEIVGDLSVEKQVVARGVKRICGRCWGPSQDPGPYPFQVGGAINGALLATKYAAFATVFTTLLDNGVTNGVYFTDLSFMNEPDFAQSGQEEIAWTTAQALTFLKSNLYPAITTWIATNNGQTWQAATGLSRPHILWGETEQWSVAASTWIPAVEGDATALPMVDIYSTHQYGSGQGASAPPSPCSHPVWQSEVFDQGVASYDATMTSALNSMSMLYNGLTTGNAQAYLYWNYEDVFDGDNEGMLGNTPATDANWKAPVIPKRAYCFGQFSRFVRPGATRISATNPPGGVNVLAFLAPTGNFVIVCINTNSSSTAISFLLSGGLSQSQFTPWITDANNNLAQQLPITVSAGTFSSTLTSKSVTTFVGVQSVATLHPVVVGHGMSV